MKSCINCQIIEKVHEFSSVNLTNLLFLLVELRHVVDRDVIENSSIVCGYSYRICCCKFKYYGFNCRSFCALCWFFSHSTNCNSVCGPPTCATYFDSIDVAACNELQCDSSVFATATKFDSVKLRTCVCC